MSISQEKKIERVEQMDGFVKVYDKNNNLILKLRGTLIKYSETTITVSVDHETVTYNIYGIPEKENTEEKLND